MKIDNPFDKKLQAQDGHIPEDIHGALVEVVDTLDLVWAGVRAVFEKDARPEHAVTLLPLVLQQAAQSRQQRDGS